MLYIAKISTRYPEFHGQGYYNFLVAETERELENMIIGYAHDFRHVDTVKTRHKSKENMFRAHPTKESLNSKYFKED